MRMLHPLGFQVFSDTGNILGEWEFALAKCKQQFGQPCSLATLQLGNPAAW